MCIELAIPEESFVKKSSFRSMFCFNRFFPETISRKKLREFSPEKVEDGRRILKKCGVGVIYAPVSNGTCGGIDMDYSKKLPMACYCGIAGAQYEYDETSQLFLRSEIFRA